MNTKLDNKKYQISSIITGGILAFLSFILFVSEQVNPYAIFITRLSAITFVIVAAANIVLGCIPLTLKNKKLVINLSIILIVLSILVIALNIFLMLYVDNYYNYYSAPNFLYFLLNIVTLVTLFNSLYLKNVKPAQTKPVTKVQETKAKTTAEEMLEKGMLTKEEYTTYCLDKQSIKTDLTTEDKVKQLNEMLQNGLITKEEYITILKELV